MANEEKKDFNAMLLENRDMPKIQIITDSASIKKYGGEKMYFAPPADYDAVMRTVPFGRVTTVGEIRSFFARKNNADFTDPITAGILFPLQRGRAISVRTIKRRTGVRSKQTAS